MNRQTSSEGSVPLNKALPSFVAMPFAGLISYISPFADSEVAAQNRRPVLWSKAIDCRYATLPTPVGPTVCEIGRAHV